MTGPITLPMTDPGDRARVAVLTVTHDDREDLAPWKAALARLDPAPELVIAVDCGSVDGTVEELSRLADADGPRLVVVSLEENLGFAGGMNRAIAEAGEDFDWYLSLNADAHPHPDYLGRLLESVERAEELGHRVGAATGRLVRPATSATQSRTIDACGMRLRPTWRHLDRGSGESDRGQYSARALVFGATGAASLFRAAALRDVRWPDGSVFDADFHSFREDAELCFRLQERSWSVLYEPAALCEHRRRVTPERRGTLPAEVNRHSLKNRYLLRAYHQRGLNLLTTLLPSTFRDLLALVWVLLFERTSLAAYAWLWRHRRTIVERRRYLAARRKCSAVELERWFWRDQMPLASGRAERVAQETEQ